MDLAVARSYTYAIPPALRGRVAKGQRVRVPFGRGNTPQVAHVIGLRGEKKFAGEAKELLGLVDEESLVDDALADLGVWLGRYYVCLPGAGIEALVPAGVKRQAGHQPPEFGLAEDVDVATVKASPVQRLILEALRDHGTRLSAEELEQLGPVTPAALRGLVTRGLILPYKPAPAGELRAVDYREPPELTPHQAAALRALGPALAGPEYGAFLLHGVTGSGKTEVYLAAIERVVAAGRQAIVLVPEISLTPQTERRFLRRFGRVAVMHSHLTDPERYRHWSRVAAGDVQVVVGARSAVFAPARALGLIVVDEEHEASFKQERPPCYHARDVAIMRAKKLGIPVLLGSATPALETWHNARVGRYTLLSMPERVGGRPLPPVATVDMLADRRRASRPPACRGRSARPAEELGRRPPGPPDAQPPRLHTLRSARAAGRSSSAPTAAAPTSTTATAAAWSATSAAAPAAAPVLPGLRGAGDVLRRHRDPAARGGGPGRLPRPRTWPGWTGTPRRGKAPTTGSSRTSATAGSRSCWAPR
jgi:primosomal protein N' (replication factor Y)